jgi:hypothetical protein
VRAVGGALEIVTRIRIRAPDAIVIDPNAADEAGGSVALPISPCSATPLSRLHVRRREGQPLAFRRQKLTSTPTKQAISATTAPERAAWAMSQPFRATLAAAHMFSESLILCVEELNHRHKAVVDQAS